MRELASLEAAAEGLHARISEAEGREAHSVDARVRAAAGDAEAARAEAARLRMPVGLATYLPPHPLLQLESQAAAHTAAMAETQAAKRAFSADLAQARAERAIADARLQEVAAEVSGLREGGAGREARVVALPC